MNSINLLQSRAVIATMLLFSFLVLEENGPARGDNTGSVDVTANVTDSTPGPECEDTAGPVTFETRLGTDENLSIDLNDILEVV